MCSRTKSRVTITSGSRTRRDPPACREARAVPRRRWRSARPSARHLVVPPSSTETCGEAEVAQREVGPDDGERVAGEDDVRRVGDAARLEVRSHRIRRRQLDADAVLHEGDRFEIDDAGAGDVAGGVARTLPARLIGVDVEHHHGRVGRVLRRATACSRPGPARRRHVRGDHRDVRRRLRARRAAPRPRRRTAAAAAVAAIDDVANDRPALVRLRSSDAARALRRGTRRNRRDGPRPLPDRAPAGRRCA